jgi:hypothetical protein
VVRVKDSTCELLCNDCGALVGSMSVKEENYFSVFTRAASSTHCLPNRWRRENQVMNALELQTIEISRDGSAWAAVLGPNLRKRCGRDSGKSFRKRCATWRTNSSENAVSRSMADCRWSLSGEKGRLERSLGHSNPDAARPIRAGELEKVRRKVVAHR